MLLIRLAGLMLTAVSFGTNTIEWRQFRCHHTCRLAYFARGGAVPFDLPTSGSWRGGITELREAWISRQ
jgi:hypothetical protein